jgi:polysaccharide chain length determinant protein (PEP-CTERM system associated)
VLPGKKYTPEDILIIAWRRKWWILVPFVIVAVATVAISHNLPNRYQSDALIQVTPQKVPEDYVRSTVTMTINERLQQISQRILSRTRLRELIEENNLYVEERRRQPMEDVLEVMSRRDIKIDIDRRGLGDRTASASFRLSFIAADPYTAQKVTRELANYFEEESKMDRRREADGTNQFLESQLAEARQNLEAQEAKLEEYRRRHAGELPTQVESNMQAVQNLQMQIQAIVESLARDRDRLLINERLLTDARAEQQQSAPVTPVMPGGIRAVGETPVAATAAEQLEMARAQLRALELKYTPDHPDIARQKRSIAELEKKIAAEALEKPVSPDAPDAKPLTPLEQARRQRIQALEAERESLDRQIAFKEGEEKRLRGLVLEYQARLEATPKRESEWISLTRDYATVEKAYQDLLLKSQNSRVAANLELQEIGEQFRILDQASLPARPISPNRPRINAMGIGGGLLLGLLLVALLEYRDSSFRTDDEVVAVLSLPVLAVIPAVTTTVERRRARRRRWLAWTATAALLVVCAAVAAWRFHLLSRFL